jgi:hypothetical protein
MAEALGRTVPASRYSPDLSLHPILGDDVKEKAARGSVAPCLRVFPLSRQHCAHDLCLTPSELGVRKRSLDEDLVRPEH